MQLLRYILLLASLDIKLTFKNNRWIKRRKYWGVDDKNYLYSSRFFVNIISNKASLSMA